MKLNYREEFFQANGWGPWPCDECHESIVIDDADFHIHHLDGDHRNSDPMNLVAMHESCHHKRHSGVPRIRQTEQLRLPGSHWLSMRSPEERSARASRSWPDDLVQRRARGVKANAALSAEERSLRSQRGWATRRANGTAHSTLTADQLSIARRKAWVTRHLVLAPSCATDTST